MLIFGIGLKILNVRLLSGKKHLTKSIQSEKYVLKKRLEKELEVNFK